MTAILRHHPRSGFTVLPNEAIRNRTLSFRAVGVLAHLLSLPEGAPVSARVLADAHTEGRDAVLATLKELAAARYYRAAVLRLADGTLRTEVTVSALPMDPDELRAQAGPALQEPGACTGPIDASAGQTESGFPGSGSPGPGSPDPVTPDSARPTSATPDPAGPDPKEEETTRRNNYPPIPPRSAGGRDDLDPLGAHAPFPGRRAAGTNPRANGSHPRAEGDRAEADRRLAAEERARAEVDAQMEARRVETLEAAREQAQALAEQLALSAVLSDEFLVRLLERIRVGLPGPLARSSFALARTLVTHARRAHAAQPGELRSALERTLVDEPARPTGGDAPPPLALAPPPPDTPPLQQRIQAILVVDREPLA